MTGAMPWGRWRARSVNKHGGCAALTRPTEDMSMLVGWVSEAHPPSVKTRFNVSVRWVSAAHPPSVKTRINVSVGWVSAAHPPSVKTRINVSVGWVSAAHPPSVKTRINVSVGWVSAAHPPSVKTRINVCVPSVEVTHCHPGGQPRNKFVSTHSRRFGDTLDRQRLAPHDYRITRFFRRVRA